MDTLKVKTKNDLYGLKVSLDEIVYCIKDNTLYHLRDISRKNKSDGWEQVSAIPRNVNNNVFAITASNGWWANMPYATETTVGGIKIGANLTIDEYGILNASGGSGTASWGSIGGLLSAQLDITTALGLKLNTTSYTAADVLAKLLTVDGAGSLLNADLLDEQEGSYYAPINSPTFVTQITTPKAIISNVTDDAILNYGGLTKNNYVSQLTGYRVSTFGEADFRYLYADQLHVKSFIADIEQALAGGQIIAKSVAKVANDFTIPAAGATASLVVEEFASFSGAVFVNGDMIRLRQFSRSDNTTLDILDVWGTIVYVSRNTSVNPFTQTYTFTRSSGGNAGGASGTIKTGTLALDYGVSGNGYYEVTAVDGDNGINSPYSQFVTWTGHPVTGLTLKVRIGNLAGITDSAFGGALSGYGLYADNVYLKGKLQISVGSGGYNNISDKPTTLNAIESGTGTKLAGIEALATVGATSVQVTAIAAAATTSTWSGVSGTGKPANYATNTTNTNQLTDGANLGGTATWSGVSSKPTGVSLFNAPSGAGLYMDGTHLGYYNGGTWTAVINNDGSATFKGVTEFGTRISTYDGISNVAIKGSDIWENSYNGDNSELYINRLGYNGGAIYSRITSICDGRGNPLLEVNGGANSVNIGTDSRDTDLYVYGNSHSYTIELASMNTAERNALPYVVGRIIFNWQTNQFEVTKNSGIWSGITTH